MSLLLLLDPRGTDPAIPAGEILHSVATLRSRHTATATLHRQQSAIGLLHRQRSAIGLLHRQHHAACGVRRSLTATTRLARRHNYNIER